MDLHPFLGSVRLRGLLRKVASCVARIGAKRARFPDGLEKVSTHEISNFELQSGVVCDRVVLSFRTFGRLNARRTNCVLFPTPFAATSNELDWVVGSNGLFDPNDYFVVVVDTFGNGCSSSPWMFDLGYCGGLNWDRFTVLDNVRAQHSLLREVMGVTSLSLAAGWSMGGQQAYQWGVTFPNAVERLAVICGSARTSAHNFVFLEGIRSAITLVVAGEELTPERLDAALRMVGRMYAGWALSQDFYREEAWRRIGHADLEGFLRDYWEAGFLKRHPLNLLAQIHTWQFADVSRGYTGGLADALARITAKTCLVPCRQDLYFRVEDNLAELPYLKRAELMVLDSIWGHRAGLPVANDVDRELLRATLDELLATSVSG